MNVTVTRTIMIQITLMIAIKMTGSVTRSSIPGQEDVTTPRRSSANSVPKLAFMELLYPHAIVYNCDLRAREQNCTQERKTTNLLSYRQKTWVSFLGIKPCARYKSGSGGVLGIQGTKPGRKVQKEGQ